MYNSELNVLKTIPPVITVCTYDTAGGSPRAADCGQARAVVSCTWNKHHIVLLHGLCDHLTNPPESQMDKNQRLAKSTQTPPLV